MRTVLLFVVFGILLTFGQDREWNPDDKFCGDQNCYEILGVSETADRSEIKTIKNTLSKMYHPDKNPTDEAAALMTQINLAWEVLKGEQRRKEYDAMLRTKRALDSPQENIIIVGGLIFALLTFVVAQYKKENYRQVKRSIIATPQVRRVFDYNKQNESASDSEKSPSSSSKKKSKKSKRKRKEKIEDINLEDYDDDALTSIIKEINLKVLNWPGRAPTYADAALIVLQSPITVTMKVCQSVWWLIRFNILGQEMTEDDIRAQILSRFGLTDEFWKSLSSEQQAGYRKDFFGAAEKKTK